MTDRAKSSEPTFWGDEAEMEALMRYRALVDAIDDGIFQLDTDGRFVAVNDALVDRTGYTHDDLLGEHVSVLFSDDDPTPDRRFERIRTDSSEQRDPFEITVQTAEGEHVRWNVRVSELELNGAVQGTVGVVRECTDRDRTESGPESEAKQNPDQHDHREQGDSEYSADPTQNEEWVRLALEAGEMGMWELDLQTKDSPIRSPQHDRIFGYEDPLEDWSFEDFLDHVQSDDRERVERRFDDAIETGSWEFDCWIVRDDGEQRRISVRGEFYYDSDGEPIRAIGVVQDITEREERKRRLSALIDNVPGMVYRCRNERGWPMEFVSDACLELTGYEPDALESGDVTWGEDIMVQEADRESVWEAVQRDAGSGGTFSETYLIETAAGKRRWVRSYGRGVFDESGTLTAVEGIISDVTERKRLEAELDDILGRVTDGFYALDSQWRFTHVNERAEELLQHDEEALLGKNLWEVFPSAGEIDEVWDAFQTALDDQVTTSYELYYDTLDFWVEANVYPSETGVSVYFRDVTDRVEREHALEESNERLEQFAYAASHDLQEPLRMVASYLTLIEQRYTEDFDEDGEEFLEFAIDGADRMRNMIDALLEYSRVDTRGDPFEPVDLDHVLEDVRSDLQMQIEETNADIVAEELPTVQGDPSQVRQVFQNLLSNAIAYSGDEPPRIDITAEHDDHWWVISVRDEGIGIDPDEQDRVFEVFERLHTLDEHSGTGIGLALSKRILERHGGDIWVDSDPGEGATFSFTLPAASDH